MVLSGKTALVTGANRRLGRATALALAAEGVSVVVHHRSSQSEAEECAQLAREKGVNAWILAADLSDPAAAAAVMERAIETAGSVDILINNASIFPRSTLAEMTWEDVSRSMQINAMAPFLIARGFAAQARSGAIVNILDTRVVHFDRVHAAYHLSKRALLTLTRMMALEYAPAVRVNAVAPGLILPPPGEDESYLEKLSASVPLRRVGSVADITEAILYLLRSEYVTGQVLFVDGGFHMMGTVYGL